MARALYLQGDVSEALMVYDGSITRGATLIGSEWRACAEVRAGHREKALSILEQQLSTARPARRVAETYACLGDEERALEFLEKAVAAHQPGIAELLQAPELSWMRQNPRFTVLRTRVNLAK
jgi:tetratricopeptide (TPR) repeat protein